MGDDEDADAMGGGPKSIMGGGGGGFVCGYREVVIG